MEMIPEKIKQAFDICSDGVDLVNSAYVSMLNDLPESEVEKRGIDSIKHEIACVQAVEASFSYGMVIFAGVLNTLVGEDGDSPDVAPDEVLSFMTSDKLMAAIMSITNLLKSGFARRTLQDYLDRAIKDAGTIEDVSKTFDIACIESIIEKIVEKANDGGNEGDVKEKLDDLLTQLAKAKSKED